MFWTTFKATAQGEQLDWCIEAAILVFLCANDRKFSLLSRVFVFQRSSSVIQFEVWDPAVGYIPCTAPAHSFLTLAWNTHWSLMQVYVGRIQMSRLQSPYRLTGFAGAFPQILSADAAFKCSLDGSISPVEKSFFPTLVCSSEHKGNDTMTLQSMNLVKVSYHRLNVYFCLPCFSVIWQQRSDRCTKVYYLTSLKLDRTFTWIFPVRKCFCAVRQHNAQQGLSKPTIYPVHKGPQPDFSADFQTPLAVQISPDFTDIITHNSLQDGRQIVVFQSPTEKQKNYECLSFYENITWLM